jgi:hypothetical protein
MRVGRGYIKLYRSTAEHWSWHRGPFSMGQFWAHLLLSANYHESTVRRGLRTVTVKRGQLLTSIEKLSPAVRRDRKTVRAWLRAFASDGMLDIETDCGGDGGYTLLTIRNYEKFQGVDPDGLDDALDDALPGEVDDGLPGQLPGGLDGQLPTSKKLKKQSKNKTEEREEGAGAPPSPGPPGFTRFWENYPSKVGGKDAALKKWKEKRCERIADEVIAGLEGNRAYLLREGGGSSPTRRLGSMRGAGRMSRAPTATTRATSTPSGSSRRRA